jgi:hypothetical protein
VLSCAITRAIGKGGAVFWRWRLLTWAILGFTGVMGIVAVLSIVGAVGGSDCGRYPDGSPERSGCEAGTVLGTGLGFGIVFCVWFVGFVILGLLWLMFRPARRPCPVCGRELRQGQQRCACGFDPRSGTAAGR